MMKSPSSRAALRELIIQALSTDYMSSSCHEGIRTGNHYQSIILGDTRTTGFRTDRAAFLNMIDFRDRKVLDLGSNLGEVSRASRARGACLVDGFEYDPFFIETANMINAYNGTTRVSFYENDITDPSVYRETYDIVLCLSVYVYIAEIVSQVASVTDQAVVLETHRLDDRGDAFYIDSFSRHFPVYRHLGESEWGLPHADTERRSVIAFARSESCLHGVLGVT
jgi:SAM-dependent methyltransferase